MKNENKINIKLKRYKEAQMILYNIEEILELLSLRGFDQLLANKCGSRALRYQM